MLSKLIRVAAFLILPVAASTSTPLPTTEPLSPKDKTAFAASLLFKDICFAFKVAVWLPVVLPTKDKVPAFNVTVSSTLSSELNAPAE